MNKIIQGDCLEKLKDLPENSVDSIVTDPPYGLEFMGKEWDKSGIANNVDMWAECLRVLKPGGYLLSFGGTRTYHRMAVAIEDAGFEVRDMIEWVYGSGFPKSLNIGKAVDKLQGNEGKKIPNNRHGGGSSDIFPERNNFTTTKGTSEWEGWGTALKPAHEPICIARKPLAEKTVAENVLKYGTGGINIDESRVGTEEQITNHSRSADSAISKGKYGDSTEQKTHQTDGQQFGRFPANLIHDNSEEVKECFPNKSERFFKSIIYTAKASKSERNKGCEGLEEKPLAFSNQAKAELKRGNESFDGGDAKGHGNKIRHLQNNHPTVKPIALMEYLIKMVTPKGGVVLDPFAGSGSTLIAAKQNGFQYIGIEREPDYVKIAEARLQAVKINNKLL